VRERIHTADGDFIDLDWLRKDHPKLIILLHGLEGSSGSAYIKGFASFFHKQGFDCCAVNFRGCSGEENLLLRSYQSGATGDLDEVMQHIASAYAYPQIVLAGFSLGGNILLKYLGEQGTGLYPQVKCAVAFSVPCDLAGSARVLASRGNRVYMNRFLKTLKKKMCMKAARFPSQVDLRNIDRIKDFKTFDDRYTAPIHGFKNAADYWAKCSSRSFIPKIRLPVLLVNALNDPFLSESCFPFDEARSSRYVYLETPGFGGHVGFSILLPNGMYWSENRAFSFIREYVDSPVEKKN
jgi:predicted alpha/beta-fold hydrolase